MKRNQVKQMDPSVQITKRIVSSVEERASTSQTRPRNDEDQTEKTDIAIQEAEEASELEKLENNGKVAGVGGFKFRKTFFNQKIFITTGLPDASSLQKISQEMLISHCASLQKKCFVIGGDSKAHFPDMKITCTSPTVDPGFAEDAAKFFSMIIPTRMHSESQQYRFFLRKGADKLDNETMIELSEDNLEQIESVYSKSFGPYLKKLHGQKFDSIEAIPKKPDAVILNVINERSNLIFRIDDFTFDSGKTRIMPNLSLRIWEHGRSGWHMTKRGVTLSTFSCHFFVATTIGIFLDQVKAIFGNLQSSLQDVVWNFETFNNENSEKDGEIEPFPN